MITPVGFIDTSQFTALFVAKHREKMIEGVLDLRDIDPASDDPLAVVDLPIMKEWKGARNLLAVIRNEGGNLIGKRLEIGRAWVETLPGGCATPWAIEEDEYAQTYTRTRTVLIPGVDCFSLSGKAMQILNVGWLHIVEHRVLHSELNLGTHPRTHLVVDVRQIEDE